MMQPAMACRTAVAASVVLGVLLAAVPGLAQDSGVQLTLDGKRTLISKDVGAERWAITLNADDGSVTGNVFFADGGAPRFVWCEETGRSNGDVSFRCSGADQCPLAPCESDEWLFIADTTLPETFFLPPLEFPSLPDAAPAWTPAGPFGGVRVQGGGAEDLPSGVQVSPDGNRVLVSKDVGAERWAITLHEDDRSVTGNVFFPGGGDPKFVWCEETGEDDGQAAFSCWGADRCVAAPCPRTDWRFLSEVTLPTSFFAPRDQTDVDSIVDAILGAMGDDDGFVAIVLALDRGYSLRQIARAALTGRLRVSGEIVTKAGAPETPAKPPAGLFAASSASHAGSVLGGGPTPQSLRDRLGESAGEAAKTELLVRLLDRGYTLDQIARVDRDEVTIVDCNDAANAAAFRECVEQWGQVVTLIDREGFELEPGEESDEVLTPRGHLPCGNGRIDGGGEQCDGLDLGGETCVTRGLAGGRLRCDELCRFDFRECRETPVCDDGFADRFELCDGADLGGNQCSDVDPEFVGGRLLCNDCTFDTSQCFRQAACGNGRIETRFGEALEQCDGPDLGGKRCDDFPEKVAGRLRCSADCLFDTSDCRGNLETDCGNGIAEGLEHCDRADRRGHGCTSAGLLFDREYAGGELGCSEECTFVFDRCVRSGSCGNGVAEGIEDCDGGDLRNQSCVSVTDPLLGRGPFTGGVLACDDACRFDVSGCDERGTCGNGIQEIFEECDREDFGGATCQTLFNRGGRLLCNADCGIDARSCEREQACGDGFVEGTEECDGFDFGGTTCADLGFLGGGHLHCGGDCQLDTSECVGRPSCGNDVAEGAEQCDGRDLAGATCTNLGFTGGGSLRCASDCRFDTSRCMGGPECGDGVAEGDEPCDGTDLRRQDCESFGFAGGTLRCFASCEIDTGDCVDELPCTDQLCPDGICIPPGGDCCGGGQWCNPGTVCVGDGGCCPFDRPLLCANLHCMPPGADCCGSSGWCSPGFVCAGSGCCPADAPQSCGDGTCTQAGRVCCGNGTSCPGGTTCLPGGGCS